MVLGIGPNTTNSFVGYTTSGKYVLTVFSLIFPHIFSNHVGTCLL
ncbi:hypothetical protein SAMN05660380_02022 [Xylella fastidiosa]|nr:hypothetical protein SAMN05660380_02022 [Xylella fastidiosa]